MFWFLKAVEKQTGKKKLTNPVSNLCHDKRKLKSGPFTALIACAANEAPVKEISVIILKKQKVSFVKVSFIFQLRNQVFLHTSFLENKVQINKNNYNIMIIMSFMSKQVSLPKFSSILQEMKINPKSDIHTFCMKAFNSETTLSADGFHMTPSLSNVLIF